MGEMTGKLLVADIDDTFLVSKHDHIPRENLIAVEKFMRAGGIFTFATGRVLEAMRQYTDCLDKSIPVIISNGAEIYDLENRKLLFHGSLGEEARSFAQTVLDSFPELSLEVHTPNGLYMVRLNRISKMHVEIVHLDYTDATLEEIKDKTWTKLLIAGEKCEIDKIAEWSKSVNFDVAFTRSAPWYFEVLPSGFNKGMALEKLTKMLNIDMKNTYAIGDFLNDTEMLTVAGYSATTEEGASELKKIANFISCKVEDGAVGKFIDHIFEINQ